MDLPPGLYIVKRRSLLTKGVTHYALADVGNRLGLLGCRDVFHPQSVTLVHQTPPRIQYETFPAGLRPEWTVADSVPDESGTRARLNQILSDPHYDILTNNCEHFVWFVATGEKKSPQLRGTIAAASLVALAWLVVREARAA